MRHHTHLGRLWPLALTALLAAPAATQGGAAPAQPESLFVPLELGVDLDLDADPAVARWRAVGVREGLLEDLAGTGGGVVTLNLFGDFEPVATFEESRPDGLDGQVLTGRILGDPLSSVIFVWRPGAVAASVRTGAELYRVGSTPDGEHYAARINESAFPRCGTGGDQHVRSAHPGEPLGVPEGADAGETADVLVMYSPQARSGAGGTNAIKNLITIAVNETNQGYANSDVQMRIRLVHTQETAQSETSDFSTMLSRYKSTGDGWYDEVHGLRNTYGADLCCIIVNSTQYCGIAYLMGYPSAGFASSAFSVVSRTCATGYYSFGHELGHNMGCHHDRQNAGGTPAYAYSYGWRTTNSAWRTIMAYSPGTRIKYFSTPYKSYGGYPLGVAHPASNSAHNARGLDEAAPTVAAWRCAVPQLYGTGMLTSQWLTLSLTWSGQPKANGSGGFLVTAFNGVPNKPGLLFFGHDDATTPFYGGVLYVAPPIQRLPVVQVNTMGMANYDFIGLSGVAAGDTVYTQFWQRDPANPAGQGVALSDALRIDVCP